MPRFFIKLMLPFLVFSGIAEAQDSAQFPIQIDSIAIYGNNKTKAEVILREIPFELPAVFNLDDIQFIQNRLSNLFLFNRAEIGMASENGKNILVIQVTESLYLFPIPLFFINERDWNKLSVGFQMTHTNFRGMHELVSLGGWLGFNPSFFINYHNPWIGKKSKLVLGFSFFGKRVGNKFFDFNERHSGGLITLGKRFSLQSRIQATVSIRQINNLPEKLSIGGDGSDVLAKFSLNYLNDHRDLFEYPRKGYYIRWSLTRGGVRDNQPQFWSALFDHRVYLKLSDRISIGGKNLLKLNTANLPLYTRNYIGFLDRIRGHFNRVMTGQHVMLHHIEARISLLPIKYISWKGAPTMAAFFQQLKYGFSLGIFMDSGVVWGKNVNTNLHRLPESSVSDFALNNTNVPLGLKNHETGFGLGLHIHLPYINVFRIDHAWNEKGQGEWILETLVVF